LKLLFEDLQNKFSSVVLVDSFVNLADPASFSSKESVYRLELHLRTLMMSLERICFSSIILGKELRDKVYNSLAKFAEIHQYSTQTKKRNYGIHYKVCVTMLVIFKKLNEELKIYLRLHWVLHRGFYHHWESLLQVQY
jgi:hypothetical protein